MLGIVERKQDPAVPLPDPSIECDGHRRKSDNLAEAFVHVVDRHRQGLAHQHGDGDLSLVSARSVDGAPGWPEATYDLADLPRQVAEPERAKALRVVILEVLDLAPLDTQLLQPPVELLKHFAQQPSVLGV